jgi:hypothetical protein
MPTFACRSVRLLAVLAILPWSLLVGAEPAAIVEQRANTVHVTWPMSSHERGVLVLNLDEDKPLIESLAISAGENEPVTVMRGLNPVTLLTVGTRDSRNPQGWGAFFDNAPRRHYETYLVTLGKRRLQLTNHGARTTISIAEAKGGNFRGDVRITVYRHSPLLHLETVMSTDEDWRAILYDAGLTSAQPEWSTVSWNDPAGNFQSTPLSARSRAKSVAVAGRTIVAQGKAGSLAAFPPPHQFFYSQDEAYNLEFVWHGQDYRGHVSEQGFGVRQSTTGDNRYVPWFNAPPGTQQRLGVFYLLTRGDAKQALDEVARYTRGDRFKKLPGHLTFTSHYHVEHSQEFMIRQRQQQTTGIPRGLEQPGFVKTFKARGADIVHLAEYHYKDGSRTPEPERLRELKLMHDELRRLSDDEILFLPGEEPNVQLGGHWISLFPKPVYWVLNRSADKAFVEEVEGYGKVYRVGSAADVLRLFDTERGLMWTAHPRIKASFNFPDYYKDTEFFRSDRFLGAAWKAMPADLSRPTLGWRGLDLLDDMSNWGARKQLLGEVDTFRMEPEFETYGHMNINYLRLAKLPRFDEGWQPVVDALRGGEFFTTTGEILIPVFNVAGKQSGQTLSLEGDGKAVLEAELEWTFPLSFAEVISGDGAKVFRQRIDLSDAESFGTRKLRVPVELKGRTWVRFEVWDIAANGAFTQPVWIESAQ